MRQDTFTHVLIGDVIALYEQIDAESPPALRRAAIRTVFAAVEGLLWQLKRGLASHISEIPRLFTAGEESFLCEETYQLNDRGEVRMQPRFIPLDRNIRLTVRIVKRLRPSYSLDFTHSGWDALKSSIAVRHRLTHPKSFQDLQVSDVELRAASAGFAWFLALALDAKEESLRHLRELIAPDLRDALDRLMDHNSESAG